MLQYLFDTDHLSLFETFNVNVWRRFSNRLGGDVGLSAITVQESLKGRLAALASQQTGIQCVRAYERLLSTVQVLNQFSHVTFDQNAETEFQQLRKRRIRIGTQDLRIAAVALTANLIVVTRNKRDFSRVPGLTLDDWSV